MKNVFCFVAINFCETDVNCSVISVVSSNDDNDIYNKEEGVLEIFRLSVDSKMRGRGVALKLVDKVLQVMIIMMKVRMVMMRGGIKMIMIIVMTEELQCNHAGRQVSSGE